MTPEFGGVSNISFIEFLQMVSGEGMAVNVKHKSNLIIHKWPSHLLLAGNSFPVNFPDDGGQTSRRMCCVLFDHTVPDDKKDLKIGQRLEKEEIGYMQWQCAHECADAQLLASCVA